MPRHIGRLVLAIGIAFFAFLGIRGLFVDSSFGMYGHYRGAAVGEIAFPPPVIKTPAYCQLCHVDRHAEWRAGGHSDVICETCHGPAEDHPADGKLPIPIYSVSLCIACHEAKPARRRDFPQVVVRQHLAGRGKPSPCIACHDPHVPERTVDPGLDQADGVEPASEMETAAGGPETAADGRGNASDDE